MEELNRWSPVLKNHTVYLVEVPKGKKGTITYKNGKVGRCVSDLDKEELNGKLLQFGDTDIEIVGVTGTKGFAITGITRSGNKITIKECLEICDAIDVPFVSSRLLQNNLELVTGSMGNESNVNEGPWNNALVFAPDGTEPEAKVTVKRVKPKPEVELREVRMTKESLLLLLEEVTGEIYIPKTNDEIVEVEVEPPAVETETEDVDQDEEEIEDAEEEQAEAEAEAEAEATDEAEVELTEVDHTPFMTDISIPEDEDIFRDLEDLNPDD